MKIEDFYELKIGQKIWWNGKEKIISFLSKAPTYCSISFEDSLTGVWFWKNMCADCSLEPPKQKSRYWIWKIRERGDGWRKTEYYYNNDGYSTEKRLYSDALGWDRLEKIKIEDDFIEV